MASSPQASQTSKLRKKRHVHKPATFFTRAESESKRQDWAFLLLNQAVASKGLLSQLMKTCSYRVCADGGANQLYDTIVEPVKPYHDQFSYLKPYLPDQIHGDLDSIRDDVRRFYQDHKVKITVDEGQNTTDFGKCLKLIRDYRKRNLKAKYDSNTEESASDRRKSVMNVDGKPHTSILVLGTLSGRVDQGVGMLSEILRAQTEHPEYEIYLIGENSLSFLLLPGENVIEFSGGHKPSIRPPMSRGVSATARPAMVRAASAKGKAPGLQPPREDLSPTQEEEDDFVPMYKPMSWSLESVIKKGLFGTKAGILPIAGPATISTRGFEWDVEDWETKMGGNMSTSNHILEKTVTVWTDQYVLFTVDMLTAGASSSAPPPKNGQRKRSSLFNTSIFSV